MEYLIILLIFPFFFSAFWALAVFIVSRMGWSHMAKQFKVERSFDGTKIGIVSAWVNLGNYRSSIILKYNEKGMHLEPIIVFRIFHPALFIPWKEIKEVRAKNILFMQYSELIVGDPMIGRIRLKSSTFNQLKFAYDQVKATTS